MLGTQRELMGNRGNMKRDKPEKLGTRHTQGYNP